MDGWRAEPALECAVDGWISVGAVAVLGLERRVVPRDDLRVGIFRSSVGVALGECARCARIGAGADEVGSEGVPWLSCGPRGAIFPSRWLRRASPPCVSSRGRGGIVGTYDEETPVGGTGHVGGGRTSGCTHHESSGSRVANMACKDQREPDSPSRASADLAPTALVGGTRLMKNGSSETAVLATKNCSS